MPATLPPLIISTASLLAEFTSTRAALEDVACDSFPEAETQDEQLALLLGRAIRAASWKIEQASQVAFFVTRYCTHELADQETLVLGTDVDEWCMPLDYVRDRWIRATGRTHLHRGYIKTLTAFRFTLEGNARIYDIDTGWLQINREKGIVHVLPSGLATAGLGYQNVLSYGVWLRGTATGQVPMLIHPRYTAGLVERTGSFALPADTSIAYDPDAASFNTQWDQNLVMAYQQQVRRLAGSLLLPAVGAVLEAGGVQISLDGLSESVNPQTLSMRADTYKKEALEWAATLRESNQGPILTML